MTAEPKGRFGNINATAYYIYLDEESKKTVLPENIPDYLRSVKPKQDVNCKRIEIKTARGYAPDLNDEYYRHKSLKDDEYHIIAKEKKHMVIAAKLDLNALEDSTGTENEHESTGTERNKKVVPVACKRYNPGLDERAYFCIKRELQRCRNQSHENIVCFYEVFAEKGDPTNTRAIWLVSERMEHTLEKYYEYLAERQTREIDIRHMGSLLVQVLRGLEYLHHLGTMHRNITPKTIGINLQNFEIKIIDFDGSRELERNQDHSTNVDTLDYYKSIEILMKEKYNAKVDIWSTAVVAIEMLGKKLFEPSGDESERKMKVRKRGVENAVKDRIFEVLAVPEGKYSSLFGRAVPYPIHSSQLNEELSKMPRTFKHGSFSFDENDFGDLMAQMLEVNRKLRPSADECLQHPFLKALNANCPEKTKKKKTYNEKQSNGAKKELYKELDAGFTRLFFGEIP